MLSIESGTDFAAEELGKGDDREFNKCIEFVLGPIARRHLNGRIDHTPANKIDLDLDVTACLDTCNLQTSAP
jgi:hypothetical protein